MRLNGKETLHSFGFEGSTKQLSKSKSLTVVGTINDDAYNTLIQKTHAEILNAFIENDLSTLDEFSKWKEGVKTIRKIQSTKLSELKADYVDYKKKRNKRKEKGFTREISKTTLAKYDDLFNSFEAVKPGLKISDLTPDYIKGKWTDYLIDDRKLSQSTLEQGYYKNLKSLIKYIQDVLKIPLEFNAKEEIRYKKYNGVYKELFLTRDELKLLLEAIPKIVKNRPSLTSSMQLCLLSLYTGLRMSDIQKFRRAEDLHGEYIRLITQKSTTGNAKIPIHSKLKELLDWMAETGTPSNSEPVLRRNTKIILQLAKIKTHCILENGKSGPKWDLFRFHDWGGTFISTVAPIFGLSITEVSSLTGKTVGTIQQYYAGTDWDEVEKKMFKKISI